MIVYNELKEFELHLMKMNRSKLTIKSYKKDIILMLEFIKKPVNEITVDDLIMYRHYITSRLEVSSVNRKIVAINRFFKILNLNVFISQQKVQFQNFLENLFTDQDIKLIIDIATNKRDYRFLAIFHTLRLTGMRISECLSLRLTDNGKTTVMVNGKGGKRRNVFISDKVKLHWNTYIQYRKNTSDKLFTGQRGGITQSGFDRMLKKYAKLADVNIAKAHAHNLRHYFSKKLAERVSITELADILGHSSLETSRIYLRSTKEELLQIVNDID